MTRDIANNPAGRAFDFLQKAKMLPSSAGVQVGSQLYRLFPFAEGPADLFTFLRETGVIASLYSEVDRMLGLCDPEQQAIFQAAIPNLRTIVNVNPLQQQWDAYKQSAMRNEDLLALRYASITLGRFYPEPMIPNEELDVIRQQIEELIAKISEAKMPEKLKAYASKSLNDLSHAVAQYELRGSEGIDLVLGSILGRAVLHDDLAPQVCANEQSEMVSWQDQFWRLMARVAKDVGTIESAARFAQLLNFGDEIPRLNSNFS